MLRKVTPPLAARVSTAAAVLAFLGTMALVGEPASIAIAVLEKTAMLFPGLLIVRAAAGPATGWLPVIAFGPFLGFGLSSLSLLGFWVLGARGPWTLAAAPVVVLGLVPLARQTSSAESAHSLAVHTGIGYLYLGRPEREQHPAAEARFDTAPQYFEPVFHNAEATIYLVK